MYKVGIVKKSNISSYESFSLAHAYSEDQDAKKVDLGIAIYKSDDGQAWTLPCVTEVEKKLIHSNTNNDELNPLGDKEFCRATEALVFGPLSTIIEKKLVFSMQTIGGTGALRVAAEFLFTCLNYTTVYTSDPTWENHVPIFRAVGFVDLRTYRYWSSQDNSFDIQGMIDDLSEAPTNSIIILQACGHNPTGFDPSNEQWSSIADVIKTRQLFPLFDLSYQGLANGKLDEDVKPIRHFANERLEMMVAVSFVKNFLLYSERIGALLVTVKDTKCVPAIRSQMSKIAISLYGSPPFYGMKIVTTILTDDALFKEWKSSLKAMVVRLVELREMLKHEVSRLRPRRNWSHISRGIGLFCFTGLTARQVEHLVFYYHIYLMKNGRINVAALNFDSIEYVGQAIRRAIREYS